MDIPLDLLLILNRWSKDFIISSVPSQWDVPSHRSRPVVHGHRGNVDLFTIIWLVVLIFFLITVIVFSISSRRSYLGSLNSNIETFGLPSIEELLPSAGLRDSAVIHKFYIVFFLKPQFIPSSAEIAAITEVITFTDSLKV